MHTRQHIVEVAEQPLACPVLPARSWQLVYFKPQVAQQLKDLLIRYFLARGTAANRSDQQYFAVSQT